MEKIDSLQKKSKEIQDALKIAKMNEEDIDRAFENWMVNKLNTKLKERGIK
ncbi:hypothetical protein [Neobacillus vireti]|uniref:hypothetical protein n=1 Tax=Neobacillus vireti TaxID=220686 RepID=UPI002FFFB602